MPVSIESLQKDVDFPNNAKGGGRKRRETEREDEGGRKRKKGKGEGIQKTSWYYQTTLFCVDLSRICRSYGQTDFKISFNVKFVSLIDLP